MIHLLATLLLLAAPTASQTVGGSFQTLYQWDGSDHGDQLGYSVSGAGDVNGDGFDDLIVGAQFTAPGGLTWAGSAYVYSGFDGALLYQWDGEASYNRLGGSVSGAGDVNGDGFADLIVGEPGADPLGKADAGSTYVFSGADGSILHQWDGEVSGNQFGYSVSDVGDANQDGFDDLIVGAVGADPGGRSDAGSAYVYSGGNGSLLHQWDGNSADDAFGNSVSGAGDVNQDGFDDLVVGAYGADPGGLSMSGSVYVYSGSNGSLLHQMNGRNAIDFFGWSVSDAGDVNADGSGDFIVGAWATGPGGSAYVYSGANGALIHEWNGKAQYDRFGDSVSGAGDVNGDGFDDLIVGAKYADLRGIANAGSAYVYSGMDGSLLLHGTGGNAGDFFGWSVSGAGDVNADGLDDLIVGAPSAEPGGYLAAGSTYVYSFNPFLRANTSVISATTGGVLNLNLNFPTDAGLDEYKVLISASGTGPSWYGVLIPLTQDSLVIDTFFGNYPVPVYNDLHGTLDTDGDASGSLTVPAGIPSSLVGNTYFLAAIANRPSQLPEYSSVAVLITITP
jgi:FG-GAP repeat protein